MWRLLPGLLVAALVLACQASPVPPAQPAAAPPAAAPPAATAAPAAATAVPPRRVVMSVPAKSLAFLPYYAGLAQGMFSAEGIDLELQVMQSNLSVAAMTAGELNYTASTGSSIQAAVSGQPFKVLLVVVKDMVFTLVAAPDVATVADLRGKNAAITNLTASDDYALRAILRGHGLPPDAVTAVTAQTTANSFAALTSGAVQAAVLSPPFDVQAERLGFRPLAAAADYLRRAQSGLVTTDRHLAEQPEEVRRMLRATLRSIAWTLDHERETVEFIGAEFGVAPDLAQGTYTRVARVLSRDGELPAEVMREEIEDSKARVEVSGEVPVERVMNLAPLQAVQRELGLRP